MEKSSKVNLNMNKNTDHYSSPLRDDSIENKKICHETKSVPVPQAFVARGKEGKVKYEEPVDAVEVRSSPEDGSSIKEGRKKLKRKRKSPLIPWKKPKGMPKRPLSAYNLFFQDRRKTIMEAVSKSNQTDTEEEAKYSRRKSQKKKSGVGFENLAKTIGKEWKALNKESKNPYVARAVIDKERYDREMVVWRKKEKEGVTRKAAPNSTNSGRERVAESTKYLGTKQQPSKSDHVSFPQNFSNFPSGFTEMKGGRSDIDSMQLMPDHVVKDLFCSSIHTTSCNSPDSVDMSSHQIPSLSIRQQLQDIGKNSIATLSDIARNQFSESMNSVFREQPHIQGASSSFNTPLVCTDRMQTNQSFQNQRQSLLPFGSTTDDRYDGETMFRRTDSRLLTAENALSPMVDLEPFPLSLPEQNHQHHHDHQHQKPLQDKHQNKNNNSRHYQGQHHHHSQQQKLHHHPNEQIAQMNVTESQNTLLGNLHTQMQMHTESQQRKINVSASEQYVPRQLPGGPTSLSPTSGLFSNTWFDYDPTVSDRNEPASQPSANRERSREKPTTLATIYRHFPYNESDFTNKVGKTCANSNSFTSSTIQQGTFAGVPSSKTYQDANTDTNRNTNDDKSFL